MPTESPPKFHPLDSSSGILCAQLKSVSQASASSASPAQLPIPHRPRRNLQQPLLGKSTDSHIPWSVCSHWFSCKSPQSRVPSRTKRTNQTIQSFRIDTLSSKKINQDTQLESFSTFDPVSSSPARYRNIQTHTEPLPPIPRHSRWLSSLRGHSA